MTPIEKYKEGVALSVPQYAIERAVLNLSPIEALALIRAAYRDDDGTLASLDDSREIYRAMQYRVSARGKSNELGLG